MLPLLLGVQGLVTLLHQPLEQPVEHGLRHGAHGIGYLIFVTTLGDELVTDLDPWLQQVLVKIGTVAAKQLSYAVTFLKSEKFISSLSQSLLFRAKSRKCIVSKEIPHYFLSCHNDVFAMSVQSSYLSAIGFSLFLTTPLLELHATHVHDSCGDLIDVVLFLLSEAQYVEGLLLAEKIPLDVSC